MQASLAHLTGGYFVENFGIHLRQLRDNMETILLRSLDWRALYFVEDFGIHLRQLRDKFETNFGTTWRHLWDNSKHPMLLSLDWRALGRVPGLDVVFDLLQAGRHLVVLHTVHLEH